MLSHHRLTVLSLIFAISLLFLTSCSQSTERIHDFQGRIVSIENNAKAMVIDHEDIPGLMRAMKMNFIVQDPGLIEGLAPGDIVSGKLKVVSGKFVITEIRKRGTTNNSQ